MLNEIVCAGLGGQGVLTAGKIMMHVAAEKGLNTTWFPSYGNEMRGGAANCNVMISDEKVASPYADHPDILFAMAERAIDTYMNPMKKGSIIIANSTIIPEDKEYRDDIKVVKVPATELAQKLGNERSANIVLLGAMIKHTSIFSKEDFEKYMCSYFESQGKGKRNEQNVKAFEAGYDYI
ncbi:2-oxoacid:acceptor oxidoreductase family protein [Abyssisolibacter fermentans]|uniref:2-oxoacid:acceptor oxidoreductase family protein n=1 Tax=Abyssisolibacter fermentans TaxID=1766203 RepID=UPI000830A882|nr:2-oxoacid:acceptor oxidoreductase family protein [Abyssisolibacter fermentans]